MSTPTEVDIFKPGIAELKNMAEGFKGLTINGIDDKEGYKRVYDGIQTLTHTRTDITKLGKAGREDARRYAAEVMKQEKELLAIITPVEAELRKQREVIDQERERQERLVLLPSRKDMLATIGVTLQDDEVLAMDEKTFAQFFQSEKISYLEAKEAERLEAEREKERLAAEEKIKAEAAEKAKQEAEAKAERDRIEAAAKVEREKQEALDRAEKDKQAALDNLKRDQEETERKRIAEEERKAREAKLLEEQKLEDQAKAEKNKKYQAWIVKVGYSPVDGDKIERVGDTFIAYKKVGEITLK